MKTIQKKVLLTIVAGQTNKTETFDLPHGFVARGVAYPSLGSTAENNMLSLGFKDDETVDIIPAVNIENWKQRSGANYMDSMKPLNFDTGGRKYSLTLSSDVAVSVDIKVEVVFMYDTAK